jgi:lipid II:glycine glycyltransferase (peptidoglycan interpeptide bridge formation enzyme)
LHPLFPIDTTALNDFGTVVQSGETVAVDLTLTEERLWRQMRSNHRRDVTRTIAAGAVATPDAMWSSLPAFVDAYRETMIRVGAGSYYHFTDNYYTELREALGAHVHLWTVGIGGEVMAGALFTECNGIVQYHLGGTRDRFLPYKPLKLLFHSAIQWFKTRGDRWMHLGGGVGGATDSLLHFKQGFSPRTFPFDTWRLVLDATAYHELLTRARRQGPGTQPLQFFPEYRQRPASEAGVTASVTNTP